MTQAMGVVWVDAMGERTLNVITTNTGASSLVAAMETACNATVLEQWEGVPTLPGLAPSTADYPTLRVVAVLYFRDNTTGSLAKLFLPAPLAGILVGDTIDPTNPLVAAIIAAAIGTLLAGSGNPVTNFDGGQLLKTRINGIASK